MCVLELQYVNGVASDQLVDAPADRRSVRVANHGRNGTAGAIARLWRKHVGIRTGHVWERKHRLSFGFIADERQHVHLVATFRQIPNRVGDSRGSAMAD